MCSCSLLFVLCLSPPADGVPPPPRAVLDLALDLPRDQPRMSASPLHLIAAAYHKGRAHLAGEVAELKVEGAHA